MNILTIPWRNARRKWVKSLLLLTIFALGAMSITALSLVSRAVGSNLEEKLSAFGANILITPRTETLTVSYGGFSMGDMSFRKALIDETAALAAIDTLALRKNISVVAPKFVHLGTVNGTPAGIIGVRWKQERALKGYWGVQGAYPKTQGEVLAGSRLAGTLGLHPGDAITIDGRPATVSGVLLPTGSDDDGVLLAGMPFVANLAGATGKATFLEVAALCAGCPIDDIVAQLSAALPNTEVTAMQQVVKQRMYSITFVERLALAVSSVILLIACASVGLSMLSSVNERVREIGLLRSLGFSRKGVFGIFCFEAVIIGLCAGVIGYLGGWGLSQKILTLLDAGGSIQFSPAGLCIAVLGAGAMAAVSAVPPAVKAASVAPADALISL